MARVLYSIAGATTAVLVALCLSIGTAAAATPASTLHLAGHHGHHHHGWDDDISGVDHADAHEILDAYFGDYSHRTSSEARDILNEYFGR